MWLIIKKTIFKRYTTIVKKKIGDVVKLKVLFYHKNQLLSPMGKYKKFIDNKFEKNVSISKWCHILNENYVKHVKRK